MSAPTPTTRLLVVDDHARSRESVASALRYSGHKVHACASAREGLAHLRSQACDIVITDLQMPGMDGLEFIKQIERLSLPVEVLMITAHATIDTAVEAMQHGAFDFIEKPFDIERLEQAVNTACSRKGLLSGAGEPAERVMVGNSPAMQHLRENLQRVARTDETVLICGESGTGKELVARAIHAASRRAKSELVSLNCPVLSEQLTESELFGHRRGAFTGADADRIGRFELAQGGTLLLDEITEIDLTLQAKLLRVLQERTFEPVGSSQSIVADVRVLASTNRDLQQEVNQGRFRQDLFYRLCVVPVTLPPLRERREDIPQLVEHFLLQSNDRLGGMARRFEASAMEVLLAYDWPGNIRELQNVVTRACVLADGEVIAADTICTWLGNPQPVAAIEPQANIAAPPEQDVTLAEMERQVILATLKRHDGHRARTAAALGIGVRTLSGKLRTYGVAPRECDLADVA